MTTWDQNYKVSKILLYECFFFKSLWGFETAQTKMKRIVFNGFKHDTLNIKQVTPSLFMNRIWTKKPSLLLADNHSKADNKGCFSLKATSTLKEILVLKINVFRSIFKIYLVHFFPLLAMDFWYLKVVCGV